MCLPDVYMPSIRRGINSRSDKVEMNPNDEEKSLYQLSWFTGQLVK